MFCALSSLCIQGKIRGDKSTMLANLCLWVNRVFDICVICMPLTSIVGASNPKISPLNFYCLIACVQLLRIGCIHQGGLVNDCFTANIVVSIISIFID